jgi:hypothetical protein
MANDKIGGNLAQFERLAPHFRKLFFRQKSKRPQGKANSMYLYFLFVSH